MDEYTAAQIDHELTRVIRRSRVRVLRLAAEIDPKLDYSGYLLLHAIGDSEDGCRSTELAESFGVHKSTISRAIATLEQLGLIERIPDPFDGRAQLLKLTDGATEKLRRIRERGHSWLVSILEDWTAEERNALVRSLAHLNQSAEQNRLS